MPKYEFLIACRDEQEEHRKKEGDIIDVKPTPWKWGRKETRRFLIVPVEAAGFLPKDIKELCEPQRENGLLFRDLPLELVFDKDGNADAEVRDDSPRGVAKRRFQIPLEILRGWMPDLDLDRVRNQDDHYQPFKENGIVVDLSEQVAIIKDKVKGSFKYGKFKTSAK